jgi:preprotein translocase subunit YajC
MIADTTRPYEAFAYEQELMTMTFRKGDKVRTDDGYMGEILFIDNDGIEAQVALEHVSLRLRTDTLRKFDENDAAAADLDKARSKRPARKAKRAKRSAKK